jgi:hypothetical protein
MTVKIEFKRFFPKRPRGQQGGAVMLPADAITEIINARDANARRRSARARCVEIINARKACKACKAGR